MAEALIGMGVIVGAAGFIASTGLGAAILTLGQIVTAGLAATMIVAAKAIGEIIDNVPDDLSQVEERVAVLADALKAVAAHSVTSAVDLLKNFIGLFNVVILVETLKIYSEAADTLRELEQIDVRMEAVLDSVNTIGAALQAVSDNSATDALSLLRNFVGIFDTAVLAETLSLYLEASDTLKVLEKVTIEEEKVLEAVNSIGAALQAVSDNSATDALSLLKSFIGHFDTAILAETLSLYLEASDTLKTLENITIEEEKVLEAVNSIGAALQAVSDNSATDALSLLKNFIGHFDTAILAETLALYLEASDTLKTLESITIEEEKVLEAVNSIGAALQAVSDNSATDAMGMLRNFIGMFDTKILIETLALYEGTVEDLQTLEGLKLSLPAIQSSISQIGEALQAVASESTASAMNALKHFVGLVDTAILAETLELYRQVAETFGELENVNFKESAVKQSIQSIEKGLALLEGEKGNNIWDSIGHLSKRMRGNKVDQVQAAVVGLGEISDALVRLEQMSLPQAESVSARITNLQTILGELTSDELWQQMGRSNQLDNGFIEGATQAVQNLVSVAEAVDRIRNIRIDAQEIGGKLNEIQNIFTYIQETTADVGKTGQQIIDTDTPAQAADAIGNLSDIAEAVDSIQNIIINQDRIRTKIEEIEQTFTYLGTIPEGVNKIGIEINSGVSEKASTAMGYLAEIATAIDTIQNIVINPTLVGDKIAEIEQTFIHLKLEGVDETVAGALEASKGVSGNASEIMGHLASIATSIDTIQNVEFDVEMVRVQLGKIRETFEHIAAIDENAPKEDALLAASKLNAAAQAAIGHLADIATSIQTLLSVEFILDDIKNQITAIQDVFTAIKDVDFELGVDTPTLTDRKGTIDQLFSLLESVGHLASVTITQEAIVGMIENANQVLQKIREFVTGAVDMGEISPIQETVNQFKKLAKSLADLSVEFYSAGTSFAAQLLEGFDSAQAPVEIHQRIIDLLMELVEKIIDFETLGQDYGKNLKTAFFDAVENLNEVVLSELEILFGFKISFDALGTNYGIKLVNGFETEIGRISGIVQRQITTLQTRLNSLTVPNMVAGRVSGFATGGLVPMSSFSPMGTDVVPAMLTPGEFVQKRSAVNTFGVNFMKRVNQSDISGAFDALTSKFNLPFTTVPSVTTTIQNVHHTTNNEHHITMNTPSVNPDFMLKGVERYFR